MSALGRGAGRAWCQAPGPTQKAGSQWTLLALPPAGKGWGVVGTVLQWPKACTQNRHPVQAVPYLSPALLLFYSLHWVSYSRPFSATSLGKEGSLRIVAKAYFFRRQSFRWGPYQALGTELRPLSQPGPGSELGDLGQVAHLSEPLCQPLNNGSSDPFVTITMNIIGPRCRY